MFGLGPKEMGLLCAVLFAAFVMLMVLQGVWNFLKAAFASNNRPCPLCRQPVDRAAIVCQHCRRDIPRGA